VRRTRSCILGGLPASLLVLASAAPAPAPSEPAAAATPASPRAAEPSAGPAQQEQPIPPPLHVDYASYGMAFVGDALLHPGSVCRDQPPDGAVPCILGSGIGVAVRGGYRSPGPWYFGGAYQFTRTASSNLYRLAIMQELRAEMRYLLDMGYRTAPYATWGLGGLVYGNEWGVETGGGSLLVGLGAEYQLSRVAVMGVALVYQPMVIAGWTDTANFERPTGMAHYLRFEVQLEVRSEITRR
jgi:hypothetical protein